jgi:hypothetical protein
MNYDPPPGWKRLAATGAVLAVSAAASLYLARAMRDRRAEREREAGVRRGPTAGRPLHAVRGAAGEEG